MQRTIGIVGGARKPRRDVAADTEADQVGNQQPNSRADAERGCCRAVTPGSVDGSSADASAKGVQHQRNRQCHYGAGNDRTP